MFSRLLLQPQPWPWRQFSGRFHGDVRNGHFELHGLAPDAEVPVYLPRSRRTSSAPRPLFSVKAAADGPITVRLEPCGLAMARLVDPNGKPLAGYRDPLSDLDGRHARPGPAGHDRGGPGPPVGRCRTTSRGSTRSTTPTWSSDAQGRITFPALIPGATYRVYDDSRPNAAGGRQLRKEFIVKPGEAIDLGDIVIEKPESSRIATNPLGATH